MGLMDAVFGPRRDAPEVAEYQRVADHLANGTGDVDFVDLNRAGRNLPQATIDQLNREAGL